MQTNIISHLDECNNLLPVFICISQQSIFHMATRNTSLKCKSHHVTLSPKLPSDLLHLEKNSHSNIHFIVFHRSSPSLCLLVTSLIISTLLTMFSHKCLLAVLLTGQGCCWGALALPLPDEHAVLLSAHFFSLVPFQFKCYYLGEDLVGS